MSAGREGVVAELEAALSRAAGLAPESAAFAELLAGLRAHAGAGKLIRPRLVELGWRAAADGPVPAAEGPAVDRLGAAFELLHTGLLVHDDVIDRDVVRRGERTVHEATRRRLAARGVPEAEAAHAGTAVALIGGDVLLVEALRLAMTCTPDPGRAALVAAVVLDAATASAAGELEDVLLGLARHTGEEPEPERILAMQRLKTAHYTVSAPLRAGALLAGADPTSPRGWGRPAPTWAWPTRWWTTCSGCSAPRSRPASPPTATCARARPPCSPRTAAATPPSAPCSTPAPPPPKSSRPPAAPSRPPGPASTPCRWPRS